MKRLLFIILLTLLAGYVVWPQNPGNYIPGGAALPGNPGIHFAGFDRQGAKLGLDLQGGTQLTLQADLSGVSDDQKTSAMDGVVNVIERRVNAYGVAEPEIQTLGSDRIIVQLPGVKDIEEAKKLIGETAKLEFKEQDASGNWIPSTGTLNGQSIALTGAYLVPGRQQVTFAGQAGLPEVSFQFNDDGAQIFQQITTRLVNKPLGIYLDGDQISAPTVQAVLSSSGVITGLSLDQAKLLALQLNAGALPVPVSIQGETTVDATLGQDSVHKSIVAGELALLVVVAFMLMYYRLPGLAASGALIVYALIALAVFKLIPVTLTLAGVAGFILSVGMAVDANILIFERMKEELRSGKTIAAAIRAGEDRAWPSIRDSNTSTLITCGVLYFFGQQFGATIIMGFALVLAIGVVTSLFSAIVVTRTFLELVLSQKWVHNARWFGMPIAPDQMGGAAVPARRSIAAAGTRGWVAAMYDFVRNRRIFYLLSAVLLIPGIISLALPGGLNPGIDFTSGTIMTIQFDNPVDQGALQDEFATLGHPEAIVQQASGSTQFIVRTRPLLQAQADASGNLGQSERETIEAALTDRFGTEQILSLDQVSPLIADQIVRYAILAVAAASVCILLYLWWAFNKVTHPVRYGATAIAALLHDTLIVIGIFSILGRLFPAEIEIESTFIVAVLTVIGFSVHDTIVVFDRIRENFIRRAGESFEDVVNHSLAQTLTRSLNTSLTVILTLVVLMLFGGDTIRTFVLALLIGITTGTYSSIFIASMLLVSWHIGELRWLWPFRGRSLRPAARPAS